MNFKINNFCTPLPSEQKAILTGTGGGSFVRNADNFFMKGG
nr:MAG TPA: hypothetical protein [Caudoviricetes sp.]